MGAKSPQGLGGGVTRDAVLRGLAVSVEGRPMWRSQHVTQPPIWMIATGPEPNDVMGSRAVHANVASSRS